MRCALLIMYVPEQYRHVYCVLCSVSGDAEVRLVDIFFMWIFSNMHIFFSNIIFCSINLAPKLHVCKQNEKKNAPNAPCGLNFANDWWERWLNERKYVCLLRNSSHCAPTLTFFYFHSEWHVEFSTIFHAGF